jgi:hypothetical protein
MKQQSCKEGVSTDEVETIILGRHIFGWFGKTSKEIPHRETDLVHYPSPHLVFREAEAFLPNSLTVGVKVP